MLVKKIFREQADFYVLFFCEFISRFSRWGVQTLVIFYLTQKLNFTQNNAYLVEGAFVALTFTSSVMGGVIADKLLGFQKTTLLGLILILIGNALLLITNNFILFTGLAAICFGTGLYITNSATLVGNLYKNELEKSQAFRFYYISTQLGGLLGPIVYGAIYIKSGWHNAFLTSIVGLLIGFALFTLRNRSFNQKEKNNLIQNDREMFPKKYYLITSFIIVALFLTIYQFMLRTPGIVAYLLNVAGLFGLIYILVSCKNFTPEERKIVYKSLLAIPFALLFFSYAFQIGNSLLVFSQNYVQRKIFQWTIPSTFFASAEPMFIVFLAPFTAKYFSYLRAKGITLKLSSKLLAGFVLTSLSFFTFYCSGKAALFSHQCPLILFLLGFALLGLADLLVMPSIMAQVSNEGIPKKIKGTMMGLLFLSVALSGYFSSIIATFTTSNSENPVTGFIIVYRNLAIFVGVIVLFLWKIKHMLESNLKYFIKETYL